MQHSSVFGHVSTDDPFHAFIYSLCVVCGVKVVVIWHSLLLLRSAFISHLAPFASLEQKQAAPSTQNSAALDIMFTPQSSFENFYGCCEENRATCCEPSLCSESCCCCCCCCSTGTQYKPPLL